MTPLGGEHGGWRPGGETDGLPGEGGGRFGKIVTRIFENPDNPLGWSIKVFRLRGIAVRVHLLTLLFVGVWLVRSISMRNEGLLYSSLAMASLLIVVLLHEFGHCFACRRAGGAADRIVMLPFGGLALVRPPHEWRAHLRTTLGGPLVNVAIVPITSLALWAIGIPEHILFHPLGWLEVVQQIQGATTMEATLRAGVWALHFVNIVILAFNVLIPAYPLDGGRIVQALAWRTMGYSAGTELAVTIGLVASMVLLVVGVAMNLVLVAVIAGFCVWSCWAERKRVRGDVDLASPSYGIGSASDLDEDNGSATDQWAERRAQRRREHAKREQGEVDRVLAKIAEGGMDSLTRAERRTLESATKKRQRE